MGDFVPTFFPVCPNAHPLQPFAAVSQRVNCSQEGYRAAFYKPQALMNKTMYRGTIYKCTVKLPWIPALLILKLLLRIKDTEIYVAIMKTQKTYFTVLLLCANHFNIPYSYLKITEYERTVNRFELSAIAKKAWELKDLNFLRWSFDGCCRTTDLWMVWMVLV